MNAPRQVNVGDIVDASRLGRFQLGLFVLLGACLVMDGFDVQAMGYVAPALIRDWKMPNAAMGPVFSAGLFGLFLGSLLFSMVADRIGRRPVLLAATCVFSVFTFLTAHAGSIPALLAIRFLAGLGLGAIMPNATALLASALMQRHWTDQDLFRAAAVPAVISAGVAFATHWVLGLPRDARTATAAR